MFSSKRQELFASDATSKKHGPTSQGRPREKRLIGNTEKSKDDESKQQETKDSPGMFVL
jgi:hypothetical protein